MLTLEERFHISQHFDESLSKAYASSIVIHMADETDHKCDIDDNKDNPENETGCEDSYHLQNKSKANNQEHKVSSLRDIQVTKLVNLQEHQDCYHIHESCVKLEILCSRAHMVTATQKTLKS